MEIEDPRLIILLEAANIPAERAWNRLENRHRCKPASEEDARSLSSREPTPATQPNRDEPGDGSKISLAFHNKPKNLDKGFVFGSDPRVCDVFLGGRGAGFSRQHFRITFHDRGEVMFENTARTEASVNYRGEPISPRNHFTWILFKKYRHIEIEVNGLKFNVCWPKIRTQCLAEHEAHRDAYLEERRNAPPSLSQLGVESQQTTALLTAQHSPRQQPIYLPEEELGRGGFGTVYKAVNVSTGDIYAAKMFHRGRWKKEVEILKNVSHEHIVEYVDFLEEHEPLLVMEYLPLGNLACQYGVTEEETLKILYQGLQALEYLHYQTPPTAHRDIKPENILVYSRTPFVIKLVDFGLAKNDSSLKTFCGTNLYAAPEIWDHRRYTALVDIWSLGVIVMQYGYGLPQPSREHKGTAWCQDLFQFAEDREGEGDALMDFISTKMLVMHDEHRQSASVCLGEVRRLWFDAIRPFDIGRKMPTRKTTAEGGTTRSVLRQPRPIAPSDRNESSKIYATGGSSETTEAAISKCELRQGIHMYKVASPQWLDQHPQGSTQIENPRSEGKDLSTLTKRRRPQATQSPTTDAVGGGQSKRARALVSCEVGEQSARVPNPGRVESINPHDVAELAPYFVINVLRQALVVRRSDFRTRATDICRAAGLPRESVAFIQREFKGSFDRVNDCKYPGIYVDFWVGVRLCRRYGLKEWENELRQLTNIHKELKLLEPELSEPASQEPIQYVELTGSSEPVMVRMSDLKINATNIVKLSGRSRDALKQLKRGWAPGSYDIVMSGPTCRMKYQGTYVNLEIGIDLCRRYKLPELEKRLKELKRAPKGTVHEAEPGHLGPSSRASRRLPESPGLNTVSAGNGSTQPREICGTNAGSDGADSRGSVSPREPRSTEQSPQSVPSLRDVGDSAPLHRLRHNISHSLPELADRHSHSAKSGLYELWDSQPQLSGLTVVRPNLNPSNYTALPDYGSFDDLFAPA